MRVYKEYGKENILNIPTFLKYVDYNILYIVMVLIYQNINQNICN